MTNMNDDFLDFPDDDEDDFGGGAASVESLDDFDAFDDFGLGGEEISDEEEDEGESNQTFILLAIGLAFVCVCLLAVTVALVLIPRDDTFAQTSTAVFLTNSARQTIIAASETAIHEQSTLQAAQTQTQFPINETATGIVHVQNTATKGAGETATSTAQTAVAIALTATQEAANVSITETKRAKDVLAGAVDVEGVLVDPDADNKPAANVILCVYLDDGDGVFNPSDSIEGTCSSERIDLRPTAGAGTVEPGPTTSSTTPTAESIGGATEEAAPTAESVATEAPPTAESVATDVPTTEPTATIEPPTAEPTATEAPTAEPTTSGGGIFPPTPTAEGAGFNPNQYVAVGRSSDDDTNDNLPAQDAPTQESLGDDPTEAPTQTPTPDTQPTQQDTPVPGTGDTLVGVPLPTGSDGTFVLSGLEPGTYWIIVGDTSIPIDVGSEPYELVVPLADGESITLSVAGTYVEDLGGNITVTPTPTPEVNQTTSAVPGIGAGDLTLTATFATPQMADTGLFDGKGDEVTPTDLLILMLMGGVLLGLVITARRLRTL